MAAPAQPATVQTEVVSAGVGARGLVPLGNALPTQPAPGKRAAHYLWAALIARIYEVFPLLCPLCGGLCAETACSLSLMKNCLSKLIAEMCKRL